MPASDQTNVTKMFYAIFHTPENSIPGSAVCAFSMDDVHAVFDGRFKAQRDPSSYWLPIDKDQEPKIRPGTCVDDSRKQTLADVDFALKFNLMDAAIPAFGGAPVYLQTGFGPRLTHITVDPQVEAVDGKRYDILFLGTEDGRVLKVLSTGSMKPVVIEDIQVFDKTTAIVNLKIYRDASKGQEMLIIVSRDQVKSIPLHRCHLRKTCRSCVALQDPFCSWYEQRCGNFKEGLQSVTTGVDDACPNKLEYTAPDEIGAVHGSPQLNSTRSLQYTAAEMAAGVIVSLLLSFVLGTLAGYCVRHRNIIVLGARKPKMLDAEGAPTAKRRANDNHYTNDPAYARNRSDSYAALTKEVTPEKPINAILSRPSTVKSNDKVYL